MFKPLNIYLSIPYCMKDTDRKDIAISVIKYLPEDKEDIFITMFNKGTTYTGKDLDAADIVVIKHVNNCFNFVSDSLTPGVAKELEKAFEAKKTILLSYRNSSGQDNLYCTNIEKTKTGKYLVRAVSGSSVDVLAYIKSCVELKKLNKSECVVSKRTSCYKYTELEFVEEKQEVKKTTVVNEVNLPLLLL